MDPDKKIVKRVQFYENGRFLEKIMEDMNGFISRHNLKREDIINIYAIGNSQVLYYWEEA